MTTFETQDQGASTLLQLPGVLARATSGVTFIHELLDVLAARFSLRDALLVVDGPAARRQAYRLHRRGWALPTGSPLPPVESAPPGLHTDPAVVDEVTAAYITDLAEVAAALDDARRDARRDALTGLLNRRSYDEALHQAAARSARYGLPFALVMVDLDHFKSINDSHGHSHGDEALRRFADDVSSCLRAGDVAARLGGDEFALLALTGGGRPGVEALVDRMRAVVASSSGRLGVRFSVGVAHFPDEADSVSDLTKLADERLFADKATGGQR